MGVEQKMSEYKTFEELKEELGDKFEDYMYKANIELLNKLQQKENIIKEVRGILKEGLEQFDTRRREEIYAEQYFENALEILDKVD